MLALDDRQRRFVLFRVHAGYNASKAAEAAGYSDSSDGYLRVQGHRLMRSKAVVAGMREEAERRLEGMHAEAIIGMSKLMRHKDAKVRKDTFDSILDRTGLGRKTTQDIRVEHTETRSTKELLDAMRKLLPAPKETVEGEFEVVSDSATE